MRPEQDNPNPIRWRLHLRSPPAKVHRFLASPGGRQQFWAQSALERDGEIEFVFFNGDSWRSRIIENSPPERFAIEYVRGSRATFDLAETAAGGTDLTLTETGLTAADRMQNLAGWVSVLLALKAAVDFGIDLRNKDGQRSWHRGYVDV
jgi:uncharacterized protein YndB with AHSA1/START domain